MLDKTTSSLIGGFYTTQEAARLLQVPVQKVIRWVNDNEETPVISRQYAKEGRGQTIGFFDMIECRFINHFRMKGISLQSLRKAAENARKELGVEHPFALSSLKFQTDRKRIFLKTAQELQDDFFIDLLTRQMVFYEFIEKSIAHDLTFDATGLAKEWRPLEKCPNVIVSPFFSRGRPIIGTNRVPTWIIYQTAVAENGDFALVADYYKITKENVEEAMLFEASLAA